MHELSGVQRCSAVMHLVIVAWLALLLCYLVFLFGVGENGVSDGPSTR
jgi:hypothetical protein